MKVNGGGVFTTKAGRYKSTEYDEKSNKNQLNSSETKKTNNVPAKKRKKIEYDGIHNVCVSWAFALARLMGFVHSLQRGILARPQSGTAISTYIIDKTQNRNQ